MTVLENVSFCPNKQRLTISLIILSLHFALNSRSSFKGRDFRMWGSTVIIGIWQPTEISGPRSSALAAAAWTGSLTFPHSWMSEWWCHTSCSHRAGWLIQLTTAWLSAAAWVFTSLFSYFFQSWLRFQGFAGLSGPLAPIIWWEVVQFAAWWASIQRLKEIKRSLGVYPAKNPAVC